MSSPHAAIDWDQALPTKQSPGASIRMSWRNLLFAHWRVDPDRLASLIPAGLELDTFDGCGWVGLIPFTMDQTRPWGLPSLPGISRFHECNVRTYVLCDGVPGVWFFSLDAASRIAVAGGRMLWKLNYVHAAFEVSTADGRTDYAVKRADGTRSRVSWREGAELPTSESGSLRHFLTERYCLYSASRGRVWRGGIHHEPWRLREAELLDLDDGLVASAGIEVEGPPCCMVGGDVEVRGWNLRRVR
ncbi:MAG: DUF2071 domain-containing protein [Planctomycetota bacterium]|nr:DUF2071 domain-containing protein [Planctomycetota bacterium]MEC8733386.1 DUF2071 domain-containing protein [Planctomycetota bacterium]